MDDSVIKESVEILIPIALFAMIAAIVIVPRYFKSLERQKMTETVRLAIEKGQPLPPEVIEALTSRSQAVASPSRDLRRGATLVAVALGLIALGVIIGIQHGQPLHPLIGVAAIPGFVGLALIAIYFLEKPRD